LQHYPALLALRTAGMAAVEAGRDDVLIRLLREPAGSNRFAHERDVPRSRSYYRVLDHDVVNAFPAWNGNNWLYTPSHLLRATVRPIFLPIVGDDAWYAQLCSRTEYPIALAQILFEGGRSAYGAAPGEFVGERQWNAEDGLILGRPLPRTRDHAAWESTATATAAAPSTTASHP
jgi:hypothetical protein